MDSPHEAQTAARSQGGISGDVEQSVKCALLQELLHRSHGAAGEAGEGLIA